MSVFEGIPKEEREQLVAQILASMNATHTRRDVSHHAWDAHDGLNRPSFWESQAGSG
jgi:hypothetical protein